MHNLLFLSRVAFICNICYVVTWLLRIVRAGAGHVTGTIIVLAVVAILLNAVFCLAVACWWLLRRPAVKRIPRWLIIINFLFLTVQLILFFR